jgi:hypothetical protein
MKVRAIAMLVAVALPLEAYAQTKPALDITNTDRAERIRQIVSAEMSSPMAVPTRRYLRAHGSRPSVALTPRFLFVRDTDLSLPTPPWTDEAAYAAAFDLAKTAWYSVQGDRVRLLLVFSAFRDGGESLFYLPLANDVQGLGEGTPANIFDDTPDLILDGFAWLGNLSALEEAAPYDAYVKEAFIHEIAHRWGAYAKIADPALPSDVLRGRQSMHWSFLADTEGSPMEGNAWSKRQDGMYVTMFDTPPVFSFSPLDLYLMGVLAPEEVPPFRLITRFSVISPADTVVDKDTAPARRSGKQVVVDAITTADITIEDVIAGSGPRTPPTAEGPIVWPVGIVLLSSGFETTSIDDLAHLEEKISGLIDDFAHATGGRMTLDVHVDGAGVMPRGGFCANVDACHRTEADRCVAVRAGDETTCERACTGDEGCGADSCCGLAADGVTRVCRRDRQLCVPPPSPMTDPATPVIDSPQADTPPPQPIAETRTKGCACLAPRADSSLPALFTLLGVALSAFARARRLRRPR